MDNCVPEQLVALARRVIEANRACGRTIVLAESCTGGLVSAALTEIPGSSDVILGAFVTYSNDMKRSALGVSSDVLETFGAVSVAVAWAMAQGALARTQADVAVSITGVAGPGGGSERKPVGTVVFAKARRGAPPEEIVADRKFFENGGRADVRLQAAVCALELMLPEP